MSPLRRRATAVAYGVVSHTVFVLAVGFLAVGLFDGLTCGAGRLHGPAAVLADALLLLQFPLLHSGLRTRRGQAVLRRLAPAGAGRTLEPTTYAALASTQVLLAFALWSPSGILLWRPGTAWTPLWWGLFASSWVFLLRALRDGDLGLQTGWIGWTALWRGEEPRYPGMSQDGLFAVCRQPIYLGFGLLLWTGPVWTLDHLAIAVVWSLYCLAGPLHKERRCLSLYGESFREYQTRVPYFFPRMSP